MAIARADIVTRVYERLRIVAEGDTLKSADRISIERAIDDAYYAMRDEVRLSWDLTDIPRHSVSGLTICASALAALPCNAPNAELHEARYEFGENMLRNANRPQIDNSIPVEQS